MNKEQRKLIKDISEVKVRGENILVEGLRETEVGGVVKGRSADDKPHQGLILAVGGDISDLQVNDTVLFNPYLATKFKLYDKTYYVVNNEDVIGFKRN